MYRPEVNRDILSPVSFLKRTAGVYPDKTAVVYGDIRYSYRQFQARVNRLANALQDRGIGHGDKVVFLCPNTPPMLEAHFAVPLIGAVLVCLDTQLLSGEYPYLIDHCDAKAVFVDSEYADRILPVVDQLLKVSLLVNICDPPGPHLLPGPEYESFLQGASDCQPVPPATASEDDLIAINYTSGTTGKPKGVMYSHRATCLHSLGEIIESSLNYDSVYLWTLPMFHCNGWGFPWAVTAVGATHVCLRRFQPKNIFSLIEQEGVSHLCAAPNVLLMMICFPKASAVKLRRPLQVLTAGSSPSPLVIQGMEDIGADITHVYGLTELHGPHSVCAWQNQWVELEPERVGRMKARQGVATITSQHMEVIDPDTMQPVPHDGLTMGEVVMRGHNVMLGYYKDQEATDLAFRGGWFHSGDLGVVHPDGYLQLIDRVSDLIVRGGDKISSIEIEDIIHQHPDVLEVAVVSSPDPDLGEVPKAFVVPKEGRAPTAEDIIAFCHSLHPRSKAPKTVEFGQLPKTATGKTIKAILRSREWHGLPWQTS